MRDEKTLAPAAAGRIALDQICHAVGLSLKPLRCSLRNYATSQQRVLTMRAAVLLLVALLVAFPGFALTAAAADDVAAAQSVIRSQEQAFVHDDAAAAYSYAAPAIRQIFPRADVFMGMVQNQYAPVYRHKSVEFGEARTEGNSVAQRVHIIDADGQAWEAMYTLEQQSDGSFKITGCSLLKAGELVLGTPSQESNADIFAINARRSFANFLPRISIQNQPTIPAI